MANYLPALFTSLVPSERPAKLGSGLVYGWQYEARDVVGPQTFGGVSLIVSRDGAKLPAKDFSHWRFGDKDYMVASVLYNNLYFAVVGTVSSGNVVDAWGPFVSPESIHSYAEVMCDSK